MGFDQDTPEKPIIEPAKKTTQVNLWIVAGVLFFLALTTGALVWLHHHSPPDAQSQPAQRSG